MAKTTPHRSFRVHPTGHEKEQIFKAMYAAIATKRFNTKFSVFEEAVKTLPEERRPVVNQMSTTKYSRLYQEWVATQPATVFQQISPLKSTPVAASQPLTGSWNNGRETLAEFMARKEAEEAEAQKEQLRLSQVAERLNPTPVAAQVTQTFAEIFQSFGKALDEKFASLRVVPAQPVDHAAIASVVNQQLEKVLGPMPELHEGRAEVKAPPVAPVTVIAPAPKPTNVVEFSQISRKPAVEEPKPLMSILVVGMEDLKLSGIRKELPLGVKLLGMTVPHGQPLTHHQKVLAKSMDRILLVKAVNKRTEKDIRQHCDAAKVDVMTGSGLAMVSLKVTSLADSVVKHKKAM